MKQTETSFNLINAKWIPVIRKSGEKSLISPSQIVEPDDPVLDIMFPRADFNGAISEFLIGLLQTCAAPEDHNQWVDWLESPPSQQQLQEKFETCQTAFELNHSQGSFLQDFNELKGEAKPVSALLIDAPGAKSVRDNIDHFIKRANVNSLCESCAAAALFTLQAYAPSGGAGHRTSLRGGGPLTTLVSLDPLGSQLPPMLWRDLWLNVVNKNEFSHIFGKSEEAYPASIFPWLAKTRTSEPKSGQDTYPEQVNPLQMYWGMPRRIKLLWDNEECQCDICGKRSQVSCREFVTQNYGVNYSGQWKHSLSPHYSVPKTGEQLPVHPQPDGISYRHWLGWTTGTDAISPALVVSQFEQRRIDGEQLILKVFGYDMDNMKARSWQQAQYRLFPMDDLDLRSEFIFYVQQLIDAANQVAGFTQSTIKEAWVSRPGDRKGDTGYLKEIFYQQTELSFFELLPELPSALKTQAALEVVKKWHQILSTTALKLFEQYAALGDISMSDPRRITESHKKLRNLINGKKFLASLGLNQQKGKAA